MADSWHTISGFATAMRGLADGLGKVGHEVGYLGWQTFGQPMGPPVYFHNRKLHFEALPNTGGSQFGQRALPYWIAKKQPDAIITLGDFWMLSWMWKSDIPQTWVYWYPIDGVPITDDIKRMLEHKNFQTIEWRRKARSKDRIWTATRQESDNSN